MLTLGFDPVLSEKGSIAYSPELALDESCYREAKACDIFVLIIGGRYGSEASGKGSADKDFYERYNSITRQEYESAIERDIPAYILIEKSVYAEYETFKKNRDNKTIKYAHVDSINVFNLIDFVLSQPRNNPIYHFEISHEIETWLRDQWAGLFKELIRTRAERKKLSSLADQIADLGNVSTTLKRYLEEIVARVGTKEQAKELISKEESRLSEARELTELEKLPPIESAQKAYGVSLQDARNAFVAAESLEDLAYRMEKLAQKGNFNAESVIGYWKSSDRGVENINRVREVLGLPLLTFAGGNVKKTGKKKRKKDNTDSSDK